MKYSILATSRSGHNFIKEMIGSWVPEAQFQMLENVLPETIYQHNIDGSRKVVVIREFKNFLASSLKALSLVGPWKENITRKITAYRAIKQEIDFPEFFKNACVIDYDKFVESREYREEKCLELGGEYTEKKLGFIPNEGNGSSFSKFEFQGIGQKMNTRERYLEILETEWKDIYNDLLNENKDLWLH